MHAILRGCAILGLIGGMAACGTTPEERGITGAGLGAAVGRVGLFELLEYRLQLGFGNTVALIDDAEANGG